MKGDTKIKKKLLQAATMLQAARLQRGGKFIIEQRRKAAIELAKLYISEVEMLIEEREKIETSPLGLPTPEWSVASKAT